MASFHQQIDWLKLALQPIIRDANSLTFLLDIEGTTTALPFVTNVLFPYAERSLEEFVTQMYPATAANPNEDTLAFLMALEAATKHVVSDTTLSPQEFTDLLKSSMASNSKVPFLKLIQGLIWKRGYQLGHFCGHVFDDTDHFMRRASTSFGPNSISTNVDIYSSGSIAAQKLLFKYSDHGDLSDYIRGYFDPTTVGIKTDPKSYVELRRNISVGESHKILFFTDSVPEVEACIASNAIDLCVFFRRPLNNPVNEAQEKLLLEHRVPSIISFAQFESALSQILGAPNSDLDEAAIIEAIDNQVRPFQITSQKLKEFH